MLFLLKKATGGSFGLQSQRLQKAITTICSYACHSPSEDQPVGRRSPPFVSDSALVLAGPANDPEAAVRIFDVGGGLFLRKGNAMKMALFLLTD
jgi:hypothetical protein